jgi:dolichol-phosphate mannosyltransferase
MDSELSPAASMTTSQPTVDLAVVIPTFNERENITPLITALDAAITGIEWQVLFVDDDSQDGTAEQIRLAAATDSRVLLLERVGRRGLSSACIEGMRTTGAPYIAVMDADLQHDERILPVMLARLNSESLDVVVGSRSTCGGSMGTFSQGRVLLSRLGTEAACLVCSCHLSDAMSGFFMLRRSFFEENVDRLKGTGFKVLLELLSAGQVPPRVAEIPYTFRERQRGSSKFGIGTGLAYLRFLAKKVSYR